MLNQAAKEKSKETVNHIGKVFFNKVEARCAISNAKDMFIRTNRELIDTSGKAVRNAMRKIIVAPKRKMIRLNGPDLMYTFDDDLDDEDDMGDTDERKP